MYSSQRLFYNVIISQVKLLNLSKCSFSSSRLPISSSNCDQSSFKLGTYHPPLQVRRFNQCSEKSGGKKCIATAVSKVFSSTRTNNNEITVNLNTIRSYSSRGGGDGGYRSQRSRSTLYYLAAVGVLIVGGSYAAVPLYRIFCQSYSYGGTTGTHDLTKDLSKMTKVDKEITIRFNADRSSSLLWNFRPEQAEIIVTPGETALAFYRAENKTPNPIDGVSTYNVIPFEAGQYFNKIQCFCFEEQRLNPGEVVELPVFFYIDPEFSEDPLMENVDLITLSYTFFESKEVPGWNQTLLGLGGHGTVKTKSK